MGKSTINSRFQRLFVCLPEGISLFPQFYCHVTVTVPRPAPKRLELRSSGRVPMTPSDWGTPAPGAAAPQWLGSGADMELIYLLTLINNHH